MVVFFIVIGVFIAIAVIRVIANANKKNKEKAEAEKAMKLLDEKEEFKKFLDYEDSNMSSSAQRTPQRQTPMPSQSQKSTQSAQYRSQPAKQQMTAELRQRYEDLKRMQAERQALNPKNVVTSSHHDSHCDISHQDRKERYKVEYVPTMNSIGGKSTEGCEDHYNIRYVKLESEKAKVKELTPLQKAIVYGEVINEPAFKRGYRGRR